jgi:hypothetical protein
MSTERGLAGTIDSEYKNASPESQNETEHVQATHLSKNSFCGEFSEMNSALVLAQASKHCDG